MAIKDNIEYVVDLTGNGARRQVRFFGAALEMWQYKGPEVIISGPYECGKSFACLHKINALALKYPKSQILMARKSYSSLIMSVWQSYINKVLPYPPSHDHCPVNIFGGGRPEWVEYPNGSKIFLGGLDNPEKVLSAEYDFIFVPQGEELLLHDYEQLTSRCTGRAGNAPYSQIIVDCNPGPPHHWILHRKAAKLLFAQHEDNPTLYDHDAGEWTPQGKRTVERLQALTGLRYKRGFLGLWAGAEGQVYEDFDPEIHIIDPFPIPKEWKKYRVMDFGYTHPTVVQWWAEDGDGRLYLYREIYKTGRITADHIRGVDGKPGIAALSAGELYEKPIICDHDAEDRAILEKAGLNTTRAKKGIKEGIELVQNRLRKAEDGRPRMFFMRDALVEVDEELEINYRPTCTSEEFSGYVWRELDTNREASIKDEVPVRTDDHGMDCLRYLVMEIDGEYYYGKARTVGY